MKRYAVMYLMGGLGNQLFQISALKYIADCSNCNRMAVDISKYKKIGIRKFELMPFIKNQNIEIECKRNIGWKMSVFFYRSYIYLAKKLHVEEKEIRFKFGKKIFIYVSVHWKSKLKTYGSKISNIYGYGYFFNIEVAEYSRAYIKNVIQNINYEKEAHKSYMESIMMDNRTIAVSIRCGQDYVDNGWPICTEKYYKSGIDYIQSIKGRCRIFVFADMIDFVETEGWFLEYDAVYVKEEKPLEAMQLMLYCKNFVCANSTFSWWGAFLADQLDKAVVMPDKFFANNDKENQFCWFDGITHLDHINGKLVR